MYATTTELKGLLRRPDLADNDPTLVLCLKGASGIVDSYCGQGLSGTDKTETFLGGGRVLILPAYPVRTITSLKENDVALTEGTDYLAMNDGTLTRLTRSLWGAKVEVAYTAGPETVPDEVKLVTLSVAARYFDNPTGLTQESLGVAWSATYGPNALSEGEKAILDRYAVGTE